MRRQALLRQVSRQGLPTFHLDAGEALVKGLVHPSPEEMEARAGLMVELIQEVDVDVFVPGPTDLAPGGLQGLRGLGRSGTKPYVVSATWIDEEGRPHFPPSVLLEEQGVRLGVVGLSRRPSSPDLRAIVGWRDPVEATLLAVAGLPGDLDLVVALSNLTDEDNDRIAREVPGLAAVLSGPGGEYDPPRRSSGAPVIEVAGRGRYISVVRAWLGSTAGTPLQLESEGVEALERFDEASRALVRMTTTGAAEPESVERLRNRVEELRAGVAGQGAGRNLAVVDPHPLGAGLEQAVSVSRRIERYKGEVLRDARQQELLEREQEPRGPRYASAGECVGCHRKQFARWTFTGHAGALATLQEREEGENPECLGCHTLGFGEPGGYGELTPLKLSKFGGVQCEACHGMLKGHPEDQEVRPQPVGPRSCLRCHDPANSPQFDYDVYLRQVHCPIGESEG